MSMKIISTILKTIIEPPATHSINKKIIAAFVVCFIVQRSEVSFLRRQRLHYHYHHQLKYMVLRYTTKYTRYTARNFNLFFEILLETSVSISGLMTNNSCQDLVIKVVFNSEFSSSIPLTCISCSINFIDFIVNYALIIIKLHKTCIRLGNYHVPFF